MADEADNLELTDQQKTRLLQIALRPPESAEPATEDETKGDLLCDLLRKPLPPRHGGQVLSSVPGNNVGLALHSVLGPPLGELLLDKTTSIDVLMQIKQYAKTQGEHAMSECEKDVFLILYFAAIASAAVFHDRTITGHAKQNLVRFFQGFAQMQWIPRDVGAVFKAAALMCDRGG